MAQQQLPRWFQEKSDTISHLRIAVQSTSEHRIAVQSASEHRIVFHNTSEHRIVVQSATEHRIAVQGVVSRWRLYYVTDNWRGLRGKRKVALRSS